MALQAVRDGKISLGRMMEMTRAATAADHISPLVEAVRAGRPIEIMAEQLQFYNSLQAFQAHRYVVDPDGQFKVAREMIEARNEAERSEELR